jgi:hypothetical protein
VTHLLAKVPVEYAFLCHDGKVFTNLVVMSDETFGYHSNPEKNDFSNWVRDVIKDKKLARDFQKSASPDQAAKKCGSKDRVPFQ